MSSMVTVRLSNGVYFFLENRIIGGLVLLCRQHMSVYLIVTLPTVNTLLLNNWGSTIVENVSWRKQNNYA